MHVVICLNPPVCLSSGSGEVDSVDDVVDERECPRGVDAIRLRETQEGDVAA